MGLSRADGAARGGERRNSATISRGPVMVRFLGSAVTLGLTLFATGFTVPPAALAQAVPYQDQVAAFSATLVRVTGMQSNLDQLVSCLAGRDRDLVRDREKLEGQIGALRRTEEELVPAVAQLQSAFGTYQSDYATEQKNAAAAALAYKNMRGREHYERYKSDCERPRPNPFCGRLMRVPGFLRRMETMQASVNDARRREEIARGGLEDAKRRLDATAGQLEGARTQLAATSAQVGPAETAMAWVRRSLASVRGAADPLRTALNEFARAFDAAKRVDLADERPRALQRLGNTAALLDVTMDHGREAVTNGETTLGTGWAKTCSAI